MPHDIDRQLRQLLGGDVHARPCVPPPLRIELRIARDSNGHGDGSGRQASVQDSPQAPGVIPGGYHHHTSQARLRAPLEERSPFGGSTRHRNRDADTLHPQEPKLLHRAIGTVVILDPSASELRVHWLGRSAKYSNTRRNAPMEQIGSLEQTLLMRVDGQHDHLRRSDRFIHDKQATDGLEKRGSREEEPDGTAKRDERQPRKAPRVLGTSWQCDRKVHPIREGRPRPPQCALRPS